MDDARVPRLPGGELPRAYLPLQLTPRLPPGRHDPLLRPSHLARAGRQAAPARRGALQGPSRRLRLGHMGRHRALVPVGRAARRLPLLLRALHRPLHGLARGQLHAGRVQRADPSPVPPVGGRRAAAFRPQRPRNAAVQALQLREPRRTPAMDDRRGTQDRPSTRDADARRVVPPSMGRDVRPLRRLVGHVDALEQPSHRRRPLQASPTAPSRSSGRGR